MKSELRAKYLTAAVGTEPVQPPVAGPLSMADQTPAIPLYEMLVDGRSEWHNVHDAALCFCINEEMGIGPRVKDSSSARPRPMTEEEKRKIFDLAMSLTAKA